MKQFKIFLLASMVMLFTTYANANANTVNMAPIISYLLSDTVTPPAPGTGTPEDPYIVGNGIHSYDTLAYFKFHVNQDDCNVLIYSSENSYYNDLYDSSYNLLPKESDLRSYKGLGVGDYTLKSSSWQNNSRGSKTGIYSPCVTTTPSYQPDIVNVGLNTFSVKEDFHLYKFEVLSASTVTVNRVDGTDYVYYYNSNIDNIYKDYGDSHVVELEPGTYYLLVNRYAYNTSNDPVFSFSIEEN